MVVVVVEVWILMVVVVDSGGDGGSRDRSRCGGSRDSGLDVAVVEIVV